MRLTDYTPTEIHDSLVTSGNNFELAALQRVWDSLSETENS